MRRFLISVRLAFWVKDTKYATLRDKDLGIVYALERRQDARSFSPMCLIVRTLGPPTGLATRIRQELRAIDPSLPVLVINTVEEQLNELLVQERLITTLSSLFGVIDQPRLYVGGDCRRNVVNGGHVRGWAAGLRADAPLTRLSPLSLLSICARLDDGGAGSTACFHATSYRSAPSQIQRLIEQGEVRQCFQKRELSR